MNESTARAERYDLQTSTSSFFLWEVPQKPVAVRIPYQLIDRLEREAVDSFRSVTSKGSEIGGLLIGEVSPGSPLVVSVAEYQVIECEYSRGPLYRLSDADLLRFQRAIEQRLSTGAGIAGFFRTHTRKGISLDPDDLAVMDAKFRDPHHFALLVRPFATKASTGAIFIREGGKINGDASYLEFPFRSSGHEGHAPTEAEAKAAPAAPAGPAPQAPQAAKPAVRAQIVPIASRREVSMAGAVIEDKPVEAPAAPVAAPVPPVAAAVPATPQPKTDRLAPRADLPRPAVKPEPKIEAKAAPKVETKPEAKPEPKPEAKQEVKPEIKTTAKLEPKLSTKPEPKVEAKAEPKVEAKLEPAAPVREPEKIVRSAALATIPEVQVDAPPKSTKGLKLVLAAALATALFVLLFVYPGLLRQSSKTPAVSTGDPSALQLHVERTNGDLLITWNRDSAAVKAATKAVLTINDGEQHENVEMDLAQLRNGSIVYPPQTADVSFKMEVVGKDASKTTSESVRVLRTNRPSPLQEPAPGQTAAKPGQPTPVNPAAPAGTPAATPAGTSPVPTAQTPDPNTAPEVSKPVAPTRSFNAQSLGARLRPAQSNDLPDAPTVAGAAVPAAAIPGVNLNSVGAAPRAPVPPPSAPAPAASTPAATPKSGGQIQQAVLIYKKDPEYPKLARQTGAKGAVKLTATVGKDGKVKSVRVLSGPPMLQAAAIDAVKQWVYKPTLLNGQPVETDTEIVLNFVGDR